MNKDWIEVELGEICDFKGGGTPSKSNPDYWNGNIPWASIKDIKGDLLTKTQDFISEDGLNNSSANIAEPDEIIIGTRINPGRPIITKIRTAVNQDLKIIKPKINVSTNFLFYSFKNLENAILKVSSGTTVLGINLTNLRQINFPLAPLPEQRAIVAKIEQLFSELDNGIQNLKTAQRKLTLYRQAVLKKAFEGGFTEQWRKEQGIVDYSNSEVWQRKCLEEVSNSISGYAFKSKEFIDDGGNYQVIRMGNVRPGIIRLDESPAFLNDIEEKILEKFLLQKNDVIITLTGTRNKRDYGHTVIINKSNLLLNQRIAALRFHRTYSPKFFLYYSWTNGFRDQFFSFETGNVGQGNVGIKAVKSSTIPLPSPNEQNQIVQEIESRLSVCDKVQETINQNLQKAEALRQSILKKAFAGNLLTQQELTACRNEPDYAPASELLKEIVN